MVITCSVGALSMLPAVREVRTESKLLLRLRGGARGVSLSVELHTRRKITTSPNTDNRHRYYMTVLTGRITGLSVRPSVHPLRAHNSKTKNHRKTRNG